ncbi:MAG TPA: aldo/keto reductase [Terracidiphilus sp.]|nr:aldo/keto reductase [Terracidiphilus sp.]
MGPYTRRDFLKTSVAAGTVATVTGLPLQASAHTAADTVTLGRSGVRVTRLAFGTGSNNGHVQAALGQQEFTRLIHYAYDHGIRFFETAEAYVTPAMLGEALKGIPRENYQLMTKVTTDEGVDPMQRFDEMRRRSMTEYFDIMLLHYQHSGDWVAKTANWRDGLNQARAKGVIKTQGASVHGLPALDQIPGQKWLDVAMIRMNHKGKNMDGPEFWTGSNPQFVPEVVAKVQEVKREGMGVISMKLVGEGSFTQREDRQKAMRFAFQHAGVDAVTVGFKNTAEIDEAIENVGQALA